MTDRQQHPPITQLDHIALHFPSQLKLSCGIPIWVIDGGDEQVCTLNIYVPGGTMHESQPLESLVTSQLCLEGSAHYHARKIAQELDYCGAWKSAQNHDTMCQLSLSTINEHYERLLPIMADALQAPTLPEEELDICRRRLAATYATLRGRVKYLAAVELRRQYYGDGHPLVADADPEALLHMSREDLVRFWRRFYHPAGCRVVLAGKVSDHMLSVTDRVLGGWTDGHSAAMPDDRWHTAPSDQMLTVVNKPGAVQAAVAMALQAVPREHPDYLPLRMVVTALGGYFGSRLMSNIREDKGYTYGISAFLSGRQHDGFVGVSTECDVRHTWQVIGEVKREIDRLRDQPIAMDELNVVRQYMLSEQLKTLDTPFSLASYVASTWLYGVYPEYYNQQIHTIMHATPQQLQQVAQRYLDNSRWRIVVAGDKKSLHNL